MPSKETLLCLTYRDNVHEFAKMCETNKRVILASLHELKQLQTRLTYTLIQLRVQEGLSTLVGLLMNVGSYVTNHLRRLHNWVLDPTSKTLTSLAIPQVDLRGQPDVAVLRSAPTARCMTL